MAGHLNCLEYLHERRGSIETLYFSLAIEVASARQAECLAYLGDCCGLDLDEQDEQYRTAFHVALMNGEELELNILFIV